MVESKDGHYEKIKQGGIAMGDLTLYGPGSPLLCCVFHTSGIISAGAPQAAESCPAAGTEQGAGSAPPRFPGTACLPRGGPERSPDPA